MIPHYRLLIIYTLVIFSFYVSNSHASKKLNHNYENKLKVLYTERDVLGWDTVLKGKILSIESRINSNKDSLKYNQSITRIVVRLISSEGIKIGDTLYIINDRNLIISKIKVKTVFKSRTFGFMLVGEGNQSLAKIGDRVVQRFEKKSFKHPFIYKVRGDYYNEIGKTGEALSLYNKTIRLDAGNPEAHLSLGYIYLNNNLIGFAYKEFIEAYKQIHRLYDNEDKYLLLRGLVETRYKSAYYHTIPQENRVNYIKEGIRYSREALRIYPTSKEVNFYLGMFYYKNPDPNDVDAKNQFLKVLDLDPNDVESYIALAELYYKHKNKKKSKYYAEQALKIDPGNKRAKFILSISQ